MNLRLYLTLIRPGVSLAVALGSMSGFAFYVLQYNTSYNFSTSSMLFTAVGSFLLCAGCSALNQVQERKQDAAMQRTARRPIATGQLTPFQGLSAALLLMLTGLSSYLIAGGFSLLVVGCGVIMSYNLVYTPLKTRSPFALLAGGIAGALPPVTGWIAAGGHMFDPHILLLFGVFYLWQVPHFWLLAEKHREDYQRAGFKLTADRLFHHDPSGRSRNRLMALWVAAYFLGLAAFLMHAPLLALCCLLVGLTAGLCMLAGHRRTAGLLVDASLPLALSATILIFW